MTKQQLIENVKLYVSLQLDELAKNNPIISIAKPLIKRGINNNIPKLSNYLNFITDENGQLDIENILPEMLDSIIKVEPFSLNVPIFGDIIIGGGNIKMTIPWTNKDIVFNTKDLELLKEMLLNKN